MTISSLEPSPEVALSDFPTIATRAMSDLRSSMTQLFSEIPGGIRKSYDVSKTLGVDARLSWQIFKLTGPGELLGLVSQVPSNATMQRLLNAATKHGMNPTKIAEVRRAFTAFDHVVKEYAGDRSMFDTMMRGVSDDELSLQADVAHRKAIFKGLRHYMAMEFDVYVNTVINYPTADAGIVDLGNLRCKMGMRRLRSDAKVILDRPKILNTGGAYDPLRTFDANSVGGHGSGILPQFCSNPLPDLKFEYDASGYPYTSLSSDTVGLQGQVDLVFGNTWRGVPLLSPDTDGNLGFGSHVHVSSPVNHFYMDVLVPRASFGALEPSLEVYGLAPMSGDAIDIRRNNPRFMFKEKIVRLSGGVESAQIRELPQYIPLLKSFCNQLNWSVDELEIFRLYLRYPIVGSQVSLRFNIASSQSDNGM